MERWLCDNRNTENVNADASYRSTSIKLYSTFGKCHKILRKNTIGRPSMWLSG